MKQWFCLFSTWHRGTGRSPVGSLPAAQTLALFERFSTGQPEPVAPKKSAETEEGLLLPLPKEEEDEEGLLSPAQSAGEENRGFLPPRQSTDERGSLPPAQSADKDQQGFLQPVPRAGDQEGAFLPPADKNQQGFLQPVPRAGDQEGAFLPPADKDQLGFLPPNSRAAEGVLPPVSGDSKYVGCLLASSRGAAEEKTGSLPPDLRGRALNIILQTDGTGMHVLQNLLPVLAGLSRPRVKMKIALSFLRLLKCNLKPGIQLPFRLLHLNLLSCRKALNVVKLGPQQLSIPACVHTLSLHLKILQEQILQFLEEKEGLMLVPWQIMLFFMKKHYPLAVPGISILGNLLHLGEKRPHRFFTAWSETYGPIMRLNNSMYILVGTPGRVLDLATRVVCNLEGCGMLAMDEADKLLSPEYLPITTQLIRLLPAGLQSLLFSANFTVNVKSFKDKYIKSPYSINLMEEMTLKEITQYYAFVEEKHKVHCLNTLFSKLQINQSVIFCNSVERIKLLAKKITDLRYSCFYIHAKMAQVHGNKVFQYTIETRADSLMVINSGELAVLASAYMDGPCQATELQFTLQAHQTAAASAHALSQFLPSLLYQMEPRGQYFQSPKYEEPTGDSHASMEHATYSQLNCKQPVIQSGFYLDVLYFSFPLRLRGSIGYQAHDKAEGWNLHRLIFILLNFLNKDLLDPGIASMHFMM